MNSIPNLIVNTLDSGHSVLLPSVGVLSIVRNSSQILSDGYTIAPPYDTLVIEDPNYTEFDVDIIQAIADINQMNYNSAFNLWNDFLDLEAVDNMLTIENMAMIDIINCEILAIDPQFAMFLSPDNEIQTIEPLESNPNPVYNNINITDIQSQQYQCDYSQQQEEEIYYEQPIQQQQPQQQRHNTPPQYTQYTQQQQYTQQPPQQQQPQPQQPQQQQYERKGNNGRTYKKQTSTVLATIISIAAVAYIAYYIATINNII